MLILVPALGLRYAIAIARLHVLIHAVGMMSVIEIFRRLIFRNMARPMLKFGARRLAASHKFETFILENEFLRALNLQDLWKLWAP